MRNDADRRCRLCRARSDRRHVLHPWSAHGTLRARRGHAAPQGAHFWDEDGRRWLDFSSQLVNVNVGHQHPTLIAAIKAQAETLCTVAPYHANAATSEAARLIAELAPGDLNRVFFTNGGAEAVENAIRMARLHTGRHKILTAYRSYHGATAGAIAATGDPRRWPSEPGAPGFARFWGPYPYRSAFHASRRRGRVRPRAGASGRHDHGRRRAGHRGDPAGIGSRRQRHPGAAGRLSAGRACACDAHGIVMIADEVMAGFGRCGEWFAVDRWNVVPDLITFAKGVNSGYVPLGGRDHERGDLRQLRDPRLSRWIDLFRPSAGLCGCGRVHRHLQGRGPDRAARAGWARK